MRKNVVSVWWCLCYVNDISPRWGLVMSWSCTVGDAHRCYISPRWGWCCVFLSVGDTGRCGISPRWGLVVMLWSCTVGDAHRYYISPRWGLVMLCVFVWWVMMCWECENSITK